MGLLSCLFGFHLKYLCANNRCAMGLFSCLFGMILTCSCLNNPIGVGPLVGQGWQAKRAYLVYST